MQVKVYEHVWVCVASVCVLHEIWCACVCVNECTLFMPGCVYLYWYIHTRGMHIHVVVPLHISVCACVIESTKTPRVTILIKHLSSQKKQT